MLNSVEKRTLLILSYVRRYGEIDPATVHKRMKHQTYHTNDEKPPGKDLSFLELRKAITSSSEHIGVRQAYRMMLASMVSNIPETVLACINKLGEKCLPEDMRDLDPDALATAMRDEFPAVHDEYVKWARDPIAYFGHELDDVLAMGSKTQRPAAQDHRREKNPAREKPQRTFYRRRSRSGTWRSSRAGKFSSGAGV